MKGWSFGGVGDDVGFQLQVVNSGVFDKLVESKGRGWQAVKSQSSMEAEDFQVSVRLACSEIQAAALGVAVPACTPWLRVCRRPTWRCRSGMVTR